MAEVTWVHKVRLVYATIKRIEVYLAHQAQSKYKKYIRQCLFTEVVVDLVMEYLAANWTFSSAFEVVVAPQIVFPQANQAKV